MGAAAALASSALWALSSVLLASQSGRVKPLMMSAIRSLTASVFLLMLLFLSDGWGQFAAASAITIVSMCRARRSRSPGAGVCASDSAVNRATVAIIGSLPFDTGFARTVRPVSGRPAPRARPRDP